MKKIDKQALLKLQELSNITGAEELQKFLQDNPDFKEWVEILKPEAREAKGEGEANNEPDFSSYQPKIETVQILKKLGAGASSHVFLAEDLSTKEKIAVKVANQHLSEDQLHRFQHEVKLLRSLNHPNIAKMIESGMTSDSRLPYISMEYVKGQNLKNYCIEQKLSLRQRVKLFLQVLQAVQYAHHKGIIHRDIKPDNILVSDSGDIKLLDFGIAMSDSNSTQQLTQLTRTGEIVGTLSYMSPEQVSGSDEIDTRTDIYSLGVVLYELLAESLPHDLDSAQIFTAISKIIEERPQRITLLNQKIDENLSAIVHHAIEKTPSQRYQSPSEFENDLKNWLDTKPVSVKSHNFWSEFKYLAARNKALFAGAGLAITGLITGLILALNFAYKEKSARQLAEANALSNQKTVDFIQELFSSADPENLYGETLTLKQVLDNAEFAFTHQLEGEELAEAKIRNTLASVYISLGEHENSQKHLDRVTQLLPQVNDGRELADLKLDQSLIQSSIHIYTNQYEKDTKEIKNLLKSNSYSIDDELKLRIQLAHGEMMLGQLEESLATITQGLDLAKDFPESHHDLLYGQLIQAMILEKTGKFEESKSINQHIIKVRKKHFGENHPRTLSALNNQAAVENNLGNFEQAQTLMHSVIAGKEQVLGPKHLSTLISKTNLLSFYVKRMDFEKADPYSQKLLAEMNEFLGPLNKYTLVVNNIRAYLLEDMGQLDEANALYTQTLNNYQNMGKDSGTELMVLQSNLAMLLMKQQKLDESESMFQKLLSNAEQNLSKDHVYYAIFIGNYGELLMKKGELEKSQSFLQKSYEQIKKTFGEEHERTQKAQKRLETVEAML